MLRVKPLLALDLDGTLWDHLDVSSTDPPYERVGNYVIVDSKGVKIRAYPGVVEALAWARRIGFIVASLSWNEPWKALEALHALGLDGLFDYHVIEPHPGKHMSLRRLLHVLRICRRVIVPPECILYVDDRRLHLEGIRRSVGRVNFRIAHQCRTLEQCRDALAEALRICRHRGNP